MSPKQNISDLEPLLDAQQDHLAMIMHESSSTDAKALGIAAANVTVLIFIAQANPEFSSWLLHATLIASFIISLLFNILTIIPHKYIGAGTDIESTPEYLKMNRQELVLQLLSNTQAAIKNNDRLNRRRWLYCTVSLAFTTIGSGILFAIL